MALTTHPPGREERRSPPPEAQNPVTGDLPPRRVEQIKTAMRRQLAQRLDMPQDASFGDLRLEEHRRDKVRTYHLRQDAPWGRIMLSAFRRSKEGIIEFPKPGQTWSDDVRENLRQQRIGELGLPQNSTWDDIEVAIAAQTLRKKFGLPQNASLRNVTFTIKEV